MTQSTIRVDGANMVEVKTVDDAHKISWKQSGLGRCEFVAKAHTNAEWLALSIEEMPYSTNARNRMAVVTLDKPAAWALRDMLNDTFGFEVKSATHRAHVKDGIATFNGTARPGDTLCIAPTPMGETNANKQFAGLVHLRDELRTHIESFREGLELAANLDGNPDNRAYWKHELKALGNIEAALKNTLD